MPAFQLTLQRLWKCLLKRLQAVLFANLAPDHETIAPDVFLAHNSLQVALVAQLACSTVAVQRHQQHLTEQKTSAMPLSAVPQLYAIASPCGAGAMRHEGRNMLASCIGHNL